jgi:chromosome segregation ATPase
MTHVQATEDNMNIVRSLIQQGFDAIAEASKLAGVVEEIKREVEDLRKSLDYLRARNSELDNMLADTRRQRDEAQREVVTLKETNQKAEVDKQTLTNDRDYLQRQLTEAQARIEAVTKERDEAQAEVAALKEKLDEAEGRLKTVEETAMRLFGLLRPEPPKAAEPTPEPVPEPREDDKPWWQKAQTAS